MTDNSQMTEQIFTNIDALGAAMESNIDLSSDIAPFMSSTLAKIKQLSIAKQGDFEAQYELFQIATNYLPSTINAYCSLPIEYRNTRIIKSDKTARQLLIDNLKLFKEQVLDLEKQLYAPIENQIKVDSSFVREKYAKQLELATELDKAGEDGFVNQFNYSEYKESPHYKDITFKREPSEQEIQAKQRSEEINKKISYVGDKALGLGSFLFNGASKVLKAIVKGAALFIAGFLTVLAELIGPMIFIGVFGGIIYAIISSQKNDNMSEAVIKASTEIHSIMKANIIPSTEIAKFTNDKTTELIDDSSYRKKMLNVTYDSKKGIITMKVDDLDQTLCMELIDDKESKFDFVSVKVNGLDLPQDNAFSYYREWKTENHNLCHLEDGNKVTIEFNNKKIYDLANDNPVLTSVEKVAKLANLEKQLDIVSATAKRHSNDKYDSYYAEFQDKVKSAIEKTKAMKTSDIK